MMRVRLRFICFAASLALTGAAGATAPKIDDDTCTQLRAEQAKFEQSGVVADMAKGPEWAKANLSPDRLREIEHYIQLDEQVKFGCRDAKLSPDAERARQAADRIEINSDADPTAPPPPKNKKKRGKTHTKAAADPSSESVKGTKVPEPKVPASAAKADTPTPPETKAAVVHDPGKPAKPADGAEPAEQDPDDGEDPPAAQK